MPSTTAGARAAMPTLVRLEEEPQRGTHRDEAAECEEQTAQPGGIPCRRGLRGGEVHLVRLVLRSNRDRICRNAVGRGGPARRRQRRVRPSAARRRAL